MIFNVYLRDRLYVRKWRPRNYQWLTNASREVYLLSDETATPSA